MMAVNRYRLKHRAKSGHRGARLAEWLLARTDKLLGVVLLGNNLINAAATSLLTMIALRTFGTNEAALSIATVTATFLILVFGEVTPKVIGARYPDRIAPAASFILVPMLRVFYPIVWFVNLIVRGLLHLARLTSSAPDSGSMGVEELRTLLAESGSFLPASHRGILLNLFDLENLTVDDVMRHRGEIEAINIDLDEAEISHALQTSHHAHLPVYRNELNEVVGIVNVRRVLAKMADEAFNEERFVESLKTPYFVPSGTPLLTQLGYFQNNRQSLGLVVDEYGELLGLVTVEDVIEEIVGEFSGVSPLQGHGWQAEEDGSYLVEGTTGLRELNRKLGLAFPTEEARTLNGLILECLEAMPEVGLTIKIANHPVEIVQVSGRRVKTARISPIKNGLGRDSSL